MLMCGVLEVFFDMLTSVPVDSDSPAMIYLFAARVIIDQLAAGILGFKTFLILPGSFTLPSVHRIAVPFDDTMKSSTALSILNRFLYFPLTISCHSIRCRLALLSMKSGYLGIAGSIFEIYANYSCILQI